MPLCLAECPPQAAGHQRWYYARKPLSRHASCLTSRSSQWDSRVKDTVAAGHDNPALAHSCRDPLAQEQNTRPAGGDGVNHQASMLDGKLAVWLECIHKISSMG